MISPPRKAVILAAGFGTRLLPLTRVVPKPLLPLGGIPMIDRALGLVRSWGVRDVVVNVHHGADALVRHLVARPPDGLRIQISFEPDILGTGGALSRAAWFFEDDRPFWILNADVAARIDPAPLLKAFRRGKTIASAWLMAGRGPRTVSCRRGYITDFASSRPGEPGTFTFCGLHVVDPAILRYLPKKGFATVVHAYREAIKDGWKVAGVPVEDAWWADIGTSAQYVKADAEAGGSPARGTVVIRKGVIHGPGVSPGRYAGIMALRAEDALEEHELVMARAWAGRAQSLVACPQSPRGSSRRFTRLYAGPRCAVMVNHDPARTENNLYAGHARFLQALGIPVPKVIAEDRSRHLALFEDAGTTSVQEEAPRHGEAWLEKTYGGVIDRMADFHEAGYAAARKRRLKLMPGFDAKLYAWEHDLFMDLFLRGHLRVGEHRLSDVRRELRLISRRLTQARPVLLHRDLQSSNILLRGRRWTLIDFQGMRFGPAVYDLASLLCDPYITMSAALRERLLVRYADRADPASRVHVLFWPAAVQRLGQALGAYARLGKLPGTGHFLNHIGPALHNLEEALQRAGRPPVLSGIVSSAVRAS